MSAKRFKEEQAKNAYALSLEPPFIMTREGLDQYFCGLSKIVKFNYKGLATACCVGEAIEEILIIAYLMRSIIVERCSAEVELVV